MKSRKTGKSIKTTSKTTVKKSPNDTITKIFENSKVTKTGKENKKKVDLRMKPNSPPSKTNLNS